MPLDTKQYVRLYYFLSWLVSAGYSFFQVTIILFYLDGKLNFLQIGALFSIYWLMVGIINIPAGVLADICGRHVLFALGGFAHVIAFLGFTFSTIFWHFVFCEIIWAIGAALQSGTLEAWVAEALKKNGSESLEKTFYIASFVGQILFMIGGILGIKLADFNINMPWYFGAAFLGLAALLALIMLRNDTFTKVSQTHGKGMLQNLYEGIKYCLTSRRLIWLVSVYAFIIVAYQTPNTQWQPLFQKYFNKPINILPWIWILITMSIAIGNILGMKIFKKCSINFKIIIGIISISLPLLLTCVVSNVIGFAALFGIHEIGRGLFSPSFNTVFNKQIDTQFRSTMLSTLDSLAICCASLGSLASGWIAKEVGLSVGWTISGGIALVSLCCFRVFSRLTTRKSPAALTC